MLAPTGGDLIDQLLPNGPDYMLIVGKAGLGKTILALNLGFSLSTGTDFLGFPCQKVVVGYLGFEGSEKKMLERIELIRRNYPNPGDNLRLRIGETLKLPRQPQKFRSLVKGLRVIIIDPLRYMVQHDYCKPENAANFISCLKQLCEHENVTVIFTHHVKKKDPRYVIEPDDLENIKGATEYADAATTVLLMERCRQPRTSKGQFGPVIADEINLYFAKVRDALNAIPPKHLKLNRQKLIFEEV